MSRVDVDTQVKVSAQAIRRINNAAKAGIRELMDDVVLPAAKEMSPRGPDANNANSLTSYTKTKGPEIIGSIMSHSGHGGYLEKGTSKMAPRPYIFPAFERAFARLREILVRRMEQFAELDTEVADGGAGRVAGMLKAGKWKRSRRKKNS